MEPASPSKTPRLPTWQEVVALNSRQPSRTPEERNAQADHLRQMRLAEESKNAVGTKPR
jgi:hypothetical protein